MNLIQDKQGFDRFVENILPELLPNEVFFVSLSARNKYLDESERVFYGLGKTEMFSRTIVRSKEGFHSAIRKLEGELSTRLTKTGQLFPEKALVVYVNINPSCAVSAHLKYAQKMNVELEQILKAQQRGKEANYLGFKRADRILLDCFQTSTGERTYLDLDLDTKDVSYLEKLVGELTAHNVEYFVIETKSGFHVLVKRNTLNGSKLRLDLLVKSLAEESGCEIMFNKNAMIPLPGSNQAGVLVRRVG